ncbi:MarR family winged helix-turn-helix transcriptional regulator [Demequina zhanjiangensis]|uniref:MarR family transcriptional regulator n=1 Tax=Demequina zhanjiangensis TaxID=3051659 RepID=A0ABT8G2C1_9MICO|nr:MarR family transcriptional regulator [Demequina sp. SYSU T00b26]MDN4473280.1 MarR family transcriptional regulator [Demequina sp. SYSU T00b26]
MDTRTDSLLRQEERVAIARLHALLELLPAALDKKLAPASLTAFEYTLLEALDEAPSGTLRLSRLASRTNATLPRLSRVVTALERKDFVVREQCPDDGRAFNAVLTAHGREALRSTQPLHAEAVRTMVLDDLSEDEVEDLAQLCLKILGRLDPDRRLEVTACLADPAPACAADPAPVPTCDADPAPACAADPEPY